MSKNRPQWRKISTDVSISHKIASLSPHARTLFFMLIPHYSAYGKMLAEPKAIKGTVCPLLVDMNEQTVTECLKEIDKKTNVKWFEHDGIHYLHSLNWEEHQDIRKDRLGPDRLPDWPGSGGAKPAPAANATPPLAISETPSIAKTDANRKAPETDKGDLQKRFERFWEAYPKKRSKGQALKAWMKIKPDERLLATMIAKIEQAKTTAQWRKDGGEYIPHPATWLNAAGWEDEMDLAGGRAELTAEEKALVEAADRAAKRYEERKPAEDEAGGVVEF